jgi:hypothetical protein
MALFSSEIKGKTCAMLFFILFIQYVTSVKIYERRVEIQGHKFEYESDLIKDITLKKASEEYLTIARKTCYHNYTPTAVEQENENVYYYPLDPTTILFIILNKETSYVCASARLDDDWKTYYWHKDETQVIMNAPLYFLKTSINQSPMTIGFLRVKEDFQVLYTHDISYATKDGKKLNHQLENLHGLIPTVECTVWMDTKITMNERYPHSYKTLSLARYEYTVFYDDHITIGDAIGITKQERRSKKKIPILPIKSYTKDSFSMKYRDYGV